MPPAKRKPVRRRKPPAPPAHVDPSLSSITLLVGQIAGELKSHINAVMHDRAEREDDRRESEKYRNDVRAKLGDLSDKIGAVAGHADKIKDLEKVAGDFKSFRNKLAGGVLVLGFFWAIAAEKIKRVWFS